MIDLPHDLLRFGELSLGHSPAGSSRAKIIWFPLDSGAHQFLLWEGPEWATVWDGHLSWCVGLEDAMQPEREETSISESFGQEN